MTEPRNLQTHPSLPAGTRVWLLAGQSNMEGIGDLAQAPKPDQRIWSFTSAGAWEVAKEPLQWYWESVTPVHQDFLRKRLPDDKAQLSNEALAKLERARRTTGAGLGVHFARCMADTLGCPVGLINTAQGGSSLEEWNPARKGEGGKSLYGAMLERVRRAGVTVEGILWYQGESECGWNYPASADEVSAEASSYAVRFADWVNSARADLGQPDLPVVIAQIGNTTVPTVSPFGWNEIRWQQYTLPEKIPHLSLIATIDLPLNDVIHLTTSGLQRTGQRMARAFLAMTHNHGWSTGPRVKELRRLPDRPDGCGEIQVLFTGVTGGWQNAENCTGFIVLGPNEKPTPDNLVFYAYRDPNDPTAMRLRTNTPPRKGDKIAYGYGRRPSCALCDAADMACPAFLLPVTI